MRTKVGMAAMFLLVMPTTAGQSGKAASTACARLAPQLAMKEQVRGSGEWRVDLLGGLGKALFGGSAASTMSVEPVADADAIDYGSYTRACTRQRIDVTCRVTGPARLVVATDKTEAHVDLAAGEKVDAGILKGRRVYCRDIG